MDVGSHRLRFLRRCPDSFRSTDEIPPSATENLRVSLKLACRKLVLNQMDETGVLRLNVVLSSDSD